MTQDGSIDASEGVATGSVENIAEPLIEGSTPPAESEQVQQADESVGNDSEAITLLASAVGVIRAEGKVLYMEPTPEGSIYSLFEIPPAGSVIEEGLLITEVNGALVLTQYINGGDLSAYPVTVETIVSADDLAEIILANLKSPDYQP